METKDQILIDQIKTMHRSHKTYGCFRTAIELGINKKRTQHVVAKQNIRAPRRKGKRFKITQFVSQTTYANLTKNLEITEPYQALRADLTYIRYQRKFIYLGIVKDIFTREILSANLSDKHDSVLNRNDESRYRKHFLSFKR